MDVTIRPVDDVMNDIADPSSVSILIVDDNTGNGWPSKPL